MVRETLANTEFLINDRLSFMRFLGLGLADRVPEAKQAISGENPVRYILGGLSRAWPPSTADGGGCGLA